MARPPRRRRRPTSTTCPPAAAPRSSSSTGEPLPALAGPGGVMATSHAADRRQLEDAPRAWPRPGVPRGSARPDRPSGRRGGGLPAVRLAAGGGDAALGLAGSRSAPRTCHWEDQGAFTGEVSAADAGRARRAAGRSSATASAGPCSARPTRPRSGAPLAAQADGLDGDLLRRRDPGRARGGETFEVLDRRPLALGALDPAGWWSPTSRCGRSAPAATRPRAGPGGPRLPAPAARRDASAADGRARLRILYGGSLKPDNARELLGQPDVDGGLIGGASLDVDSFSAIIRAAAECAAGDEFVTVSARHPVHPGLPLPDPGRAAAAGQGRRPRRCLRWRRQPDLVRAADRHQHHAPADRRSRSCCSWCCR